MDQHRTCLIKGAAIRGYVGNHALLRYDLRVMSISAIIETALLSHTLFAALLSFVRDAWEVR